MFGFKRIYIYIFYFISSFPEGRVEVGGGCMYVWLQSSVVWAAIHAWHMNCHFPQTSLSMRQRIRLIAKIIAMNGDEYE